MLGPSNKSTSFLQISIGFNKSFALFWEQRVVGSNPFAPTRLSQGRRVELAEDAPRFRSLDFLCWHVTGNQIPCCDTLNTLFCSLRHPRIGLNFLQRQGISDSPCTRSHAIPCIFPCSREFAEWGADRIRLHLPPAITHPSLSFLGMRILHHRFLMHSKAREPASYPADFHLCVKTFRHACLRSHHRTRSPLARASIRFRASPIACPTAKPGNPAGRRMR